MGCFFCGGPAHPATGCQYTERVIACGRCTREAWAWVKGWTNRKRKDGLSFYEAAAYRPPVRPATESSEERTCPSRPRLR